MRHLSFLRVGLIAAATIGVLACQRGEDSPRRIILISLDTLRADHLSLYGYDRLTSPNLERLASDSVVFDRAYAQSTWTLPSHISIFTGLQPSVHGVNDTKTRLAESIWTLPELLKRDGFATTAFTDGGFVGGEYGFADGFDEYREEDFEAEAGKRGLEKNYPHIESWVRDHSDESFFLFVHTFDVHGPYRAEGEYFDRFLPEAESTPEGVAELEYVETLGDCDYLELDRFESLEELIAAYDGGILYVDHMVGRLVRLLEELGIYEDTMLVITSDHGESFLDEGVYVGHGGWLHDGEARIPLIVKFPENRFGGERVPNVVESVDLLPTILEAWDVPRPDDLLLQGMDLSRLVRGQEDRSPIAVTANLKHLDNYALRTRDWTLLSEIPDYQLEGWFTEGRLRPRDEEAFWSRLRNEPMLIPTGARPEKNLRDENRSLFESLSKELAKWRRAQEDLKKLVENPRMRDAFTPEEIQHLKQLGYLGGDSDE